MNRALSLLYSTPATPTDSSATSSTSLGRAGHNGGSHAATEQNGASSSTSPITEPTVDPKPLENRPCKKYSNGAGEWTFYMDRDEALLPELESARRLIERLKSGEEIAVGNYRYRIKDKLLKRFRAS